MTIPNETSRISYFWLLVAEEDGRVLTADEDAAPAVFSGEGGGGAVPAPCGRGRQVEDQTDRSP